MKVLAQSSRTLRSLPLAGLRGDYHIEREHTCVLLTPMCAPYPTPSLRIMLCTWQKKNISKVSNFTAHAWPDETLVTLNRATPKEIELRYHTTLQRGLCGLSQGLGAITGPAISGAHVDKHQNVT